MAPVNTTVMPMRVVEVPTSPASTRLFTTPDCTWHAAATAVVIGSANGLKAYGARRHWETST